MKKTFLFFIVLCFFLSAAAPCLAEEPPEQAVSPPEISAEKAVILNAKNGRVLFGKNETETGYCGFLPRLMTCVLLMESGQDLETEIIVPNQVNALTKQRSSAELTEGDAISLSDLMTAVLVGNAQEAAYAIALYLSDGNIGAFIEKMNARAAELGAADTVFTEPAGYYEEGTKAKTTAIDAAKIAAQAATFDEILSKSNIATANLTVNGKKRILYTRNAIIDQNDESFSPKASGLSVHGDPRIGSSMVSTNNSTGSRFIAVVISTKPVTETFPDIRKLLDYSVASFHTVTLIDKSTPVSEIKVKQAKGKDTLILIPEETIQALLPKNLDSEKLERIIDLPNELQAPIEKGTAVGKITLIYEDTVYGETALITQTQAELDLVQNYTEKISIFFKKTSVRLVIVVLLLLIVIYIFITYLKNRKKQKKKKITSHQRVNFHKPEEK